MKITIGKKLMGSFIALSLIVAVAGLIGLIMVKKVARSGDVVLEEKVPLKAVAMEAVVTAERAMGACRNYLLSETGLSEIEDEISRHIDEFDMYMSMARHGTDSEKFKNSPAGRLYAKNGLSIEVPRGTGEMLNLVEKINGPQTTFSNKARELTSLHKNRVQYSFVYNDIHYDLPKFLYAADLKHRRWFEDLENSVEYEVNFTGEIDPTKCFLGAWYQSYTSEDEELTAMLEEFQSVHAKFHEVGRNVMLADGGQKESLLLRGMRYSTKLISGLDNLEQYAEAKIDELVKQEKACVDEMFGASEKMTELLGEFAEVADNDMKLAQSNARRAKSFSIWMLIFLMPCAVSLALILGFLITRSITRPLMEGTNTLASAISQISSTASELAASATETSSSISEITTTVEEVKQTAHLSNEKSEHVAEKSGKVVQISEGGKKATEDTIAGMNRIKEEMESIADSIVRLSEQTQSVQEIINTVNDISDQSNLLSVNASIEAARAGEYGKSFAVVAQEVKSLANQSKKATDQVKIILNDIQKATNTAMTATDRGTKAVEEGEGLSGQAGDSIKALVEGIEESAQSATQIAASSHQQLVGTDQLATAMENIKEASIQNLESTRQLEGSARGLEDLGLKLKELAGVSSNGKSKV